MGEELRGTVMMKTVEGKEIILENAIITEITKSEENQFDDFIDDFIRKIDPMSYEVSVKIKPLSKKRFVKLLMSRGMQRNEANEMAKYVLRKYGEYSPTYLMFI